MRISTKGKYALILLVDIAENQNESGDFVSLSDVSSRHNISKKYLERSMFWGASLMWLVDAVAEYLEAGAEEYFNPAASDMINDAFLGMCVVALAMVIWIVALLIRDPEKVVLNILKKKSR